MQEAHEFLKALTVVLCVAAVTTVLFQRLNQPVVLGYLLAGVIVGPYVPIPLVADPRVVQTLSELGVILLMFSLGLEFSLRKLARVGPTAGVTALIQCTLMMWLGFVVGRAFGWTDLESLFAGAIVAISSTTIIAKAFDEQGIRGRLRELVVGVLIVEDLIAIVLMAALTAVSSGSGLSAGELGITLGKLAAFLVGLLVLGLLVIPRAMRFIVGLGRSETTLVASIGLCFAIALLAQEFGYSVALGAFLAGSLVAESGHEQIVEHLVQPVRDMFAAVFFVSVGMLIDPALIVQYWPAIAALTAIVILGKIVSVALGAFLTGNGTRTSVQAGMSLAQIGEFSFIIAALGLTLKATGPFLYPVAVAVSAITTLLTPWLIRGSGPLANYVDRKLPKALQTFAVLYGSWVESLGQPSPAAGAEGALAARRKRLVRLLLVDALLLGIVVVGVSALADWLAALIQRHSGLEDGPAHLVVLAGGVALALPFCVGLMRVALGLGRNLADRAFPPAEAGKADLAAAPRGAMATTLQLVLVLAVGIPLLAVSQPFLSGLEGLLVLGAVVAALGIGFWRSATNLQGHVRAGAEVILAALMARSPDAPRAPTTALAQVSALLPGLGEPVPVTLRADSPAVGQTLVQLNLRGMTGATVLAIQRQPGGVLVPSAQEVLQAGDVLALAGSHEAVDAATGLLLGAKNS